MATENHLDRAEKFPDLLRRLAPLTFLIRVQAFRHLLREELPHSKSSWMMDPTGSREMPSCSAIGLAEIRLSSKISSWIWSFISGVVTVLGRPGRGASQVEKSPLLNWATQFLTVAYDGACFPNVSARMAWISFGNLPSRKKNWWQLASRCCWNRARLLTCFHSASVTRKDLHSVHEQTPLFNDTIYSVLRHREVGRAKHVSVIPPIYLFLWELKLYVVEHDVRLVITARILFLYVSPCTVVDLKSLDTWI